MRLVAGLLLIGLAGAGDAWSQTKRKAVAPPPPAEAAVPPPPPQEATACSRAYHAALTGLHDRLKPDLTSTRAALRQSISDLPLRWVFADPKPPLDWIVATTARLELKDGKNFCTKVVVDAGAASCTLPDGSGVPVATPLPLALIDEELRIQRLLEVYLRARGAAPELTNNGKFHWTLSRVRQDIENLTGQPPNAALCTGVPEAVQFITAQFAPIAKRVDDVAAVTRLAGDIAIRRVAASGVIDPPLEGTAFSGLLGPQQLTDMAANALLAEVPAAAVKAAPTLSAKFALAADALRDESSSELGSKPGIVRGLAKSVFRSIEVFAFSAELHVRYQQLQKAYVGGLSAIVAEHKAQCTCAD